MTNIGIKEQSRREIAHKLNILLANEFLLYTKTLKYHWNVEGKNFDANHKFFKEQYESLFQIIDDVAERTRSLGFFAFGTLTEFIKYGSIKEDPQEDSTDLEMIEELLGNHELIIQNLRSEIEAILQLGDAGTNNFLTDIMEKHEKMAWMLRSFLE